MWRRYVLPTWQKVAADISARFGHITIVEWIAILIVYTFFRLLS